MNNEQNAVTTQDSDISDTIQNDLFSSYDTPELDYIVFDDDPFCNNYDDTSTMFDNELYKTLSLDEDDLQPYRSKSDNQSLQQRLGFSKF